MAKIIEKTMIVKLSAIVKNKGEDDLPPISEETLLAIEQVAQELVGKDWIVEVEQSS